MKPLGFRPPAALLQDRHGLSWPRQGSVCSGFPWTLGRARRGRVCLGQRSSLLCSTAMQLGMRSSSSGSSQPLLGGSVPASCSHSWFLPHQASSVPPPGLLAETSAPQVHALIDTRVDSLQCTPARFPRPDLQGRLFVAPGTRLLT